MSIGKEPSQTGFLRSAAPRFTTGLPLAFSRTAALAFSYSESRGAVCLPCVFAAPGVSMAKRNTRCRAIHSPSVNPSNVHISLGIELLRITGRNSDNSTALFVPV